MVILVIQDMDSAPHPSLVIARYKKLWLQFSCLVRQTGVATCYTYGFYILYLFLMLTVSIYGLISRVTKGMEPKYVYLVGDSLITGTTLYVVCDSANSVTNEVHHPVVCHICEPSAVDLFKTPLISVS
jgi:hypothetical protein